MSASVRMLGHELHKAPIPPEMGEAYLGEDESGTELRLSFRPWHHPGPDAWIASVLVCDRTLAAATGRTREEAEAALSAELGRLTRLAARGAL